MGLIDQFFTGLFKIIPAEYFALASGIIGTCTFILSFILYSLGEPISVFTHYISNLGVGPHGSGIVFGIGIGITIALMIPFVYALKLWLWSESKLTNTIFVGSFIFTLISFISFMIVLFYDMEAAALIHDISAAIFFFSTVSMTLLLTIVMELEGKISTFQWICTTNLLVISIIFFPWYFRTIFYMYPLLELTLDDWVIMMGSMDPKLDGVRYFEWLGVIFTIIWVIQTGFHYRRNSGHIYHEEIIKIPFLNRYRHKDQNNPT
ncbi:hypothetical protein DSAG12_03704 [Promethearchaeum syntrophicum]|uniref:DUF998 domain-containing protein n=1 Tax=Promethearchaeum syntrophicum TaxID=2594042 RepID=A0A5B9DGL0_9ARCH|nr:hypothetical protein [Candidatus Prometheoarchaeum syntrophicum]QEE17866.1 hypothetical protein DSAG12_03704 [Candidatus Prometheoarchaeum syntrophicum]